MVPSERANTEKLKCRKIDLKIKTLPFYFRNIQTLEQVAQRSYELSFSRSSQKLIENGPWQSAVADHVLIRDLDEVISRVSFRSQQFFHSVV